MAFRHLKKRIQIQVTVLLKKVISSNNIHKDIWNFTSITCYHVLLWYFTINNIFQNQNKQFQCINMLLYELSYETKTKNVIRILKSCWLYSANNWEFLKLNNWCKFCDKEITTNWNIWCNFFPQNLPIFLLKKITKW